MRAAIHAHTAHLLMAIMVGRARDHRDDDGDDGAPAGMDARRTPAPKPKAAAGKKNSKSAASGAGVVRRKHDGARGAAGIEAIGWRLGHAPRLPALWHGGWRGSNESSANKIGRWRSQHTHTQVATGSLSGGGPAAAAASRCCFARTKATTRAFDDSAPWPLWPSPNWAPATAFPGTRRGPPAFDADAEGRMSCGAGLIGQASLD